ncbi:MAG: F0F1 ATP synthase subunit C [Desulfovibrio sp.]|nr:MAG: F0F1 ATP synthase subunit C [Desulfovibrio sp.]
MRKLVLVTLNVVWMLAIAAIASAAVDAHIADAASTIGLAMCFGMGIAAFGCGLGQGIGLKAACEGTARNPEAGGKIMVTLILGLAFIESLAIYALVICLMLSGNVSLA